jgi:hypothetical protein
MPCRFDCEETLRLKGVNCLGSNQCREMQARIKDYRDSVRMHFGRAFSFDFTLPTQSLNRRASLDQTHINKGSV